MSDDGFSIVKETDVGTWIHLVCALYTPNISFFDPERHQEHDILLTAIFKSLKWLFGAEIF